jgi:hypothetical protein
MLPSAKLTSREGWHFTHFPPVEAARPEFNKNLLNNALTIANGLRV